MTPYATKQPRSMPTFVVMTGTGPPPYSVATQESMVCCSRNSQ
jgi:hypothetical protein